MKESFVENNKTNQSEITFELGTDKFKLKTYNIGLAPEGGIISPGIMETGKIPDAEKELPAEKSLVQKFLKDKYGYLAPYSFLSSDGGVVTGNYTTAEGQKEFLESDLVITDQSFDPPEWIKKLWRFAELKNKKGFTKDSLMACIRNLEIKKEKKVFTVGSGLYSQSFYTNGAEGTIISLSEDEKEKIKGILNPEEIIELENSYGYLSKKYQNKSIREIILDRYNNQLPEFNSQIHNNSIGVAGMVLTEKDNSFIFANRGKNVSVNFGINCTASGAVEFNRDELSTYGLSQSLGNEMSRETNMELGFKSGELLIAGMRKKLKVELGLEPSDYELIPVGFVRELTRGGKPECIFLINYHGSSEDVVNSIINNQNPEKKEIEGFVYSQPAEETAKFLKTKGVENCLQHKGIINLILAVEYLKNKNQ